MVYVVEDEFSVVLTLSGLGITVNLKLLDWSDMGFTLLSVETILITNSPICLVASVGLMVIIFLIGSKFKAGIMEPGPFNLINTESPSGSVIDGS